MKLSLIIAAVALIGMSACTTTEEKDELAAEPVAAEGDAAAAAAPAEETSKDGEEASELQENKDNLPTELPAETKMETQEEPKAEVAAATQTSPELYISTSHLNVRNGPGMNYPVVEVLTFNSPVASLGTENRIWVKIGEGRYASKKFLSETKLTQPMAVESSAPIEMVKEADAEPTVAPIETAPMESATEAADADGTFEDGEMEEVAPAPAE